MPLSPPDFFVATGGDLEPDWFALTARERGGGVYADAEAKALALLAAWLDRAEARGHDVSLDYDEGAAAVAYVYVRAWAYLIDAAYLIAPAEGDVDAKGGYKRQQWQMAHALRRLAAWEAALEAATATAGTFAVVRSLR